MVKHGAFFIFCFVSAAAAAAPLPLLEALPGPGLPVKKLWKQAVPGLMTDLAVARGGGATLVATVPNPDATGLAEHGHGLTRFDRNGRRVWHLELEAAVKSLAVSDDGKLALVSTYDNRLAAIDPRGKTRWVVEATCKPVALRAQFLCYHDDDAEPRVAFDIYSAKGRKELSYPISSDVLALKVSDDERNVVVALQGGQVILFGADFRVRWRRQVPGEVLDVAVSAGPEPRVAALYNEAGAPGAGAAQAAAVPAAPGQQIRVFAAGGRELARALPAARVREIELVPSGIGFAVYGNGAAGQQLSYYDVPLAPPAAAGGGEAPLLPERWRRTDPRAAEFSSYLIVTADSLILGSEENLETSRRSHVTAYDFGGSLKWDLPLVTEDGAYLYAHGLAPAAALLSVGTDDGYVSAFQLRKGATALSARPR